MTKTQQAFRPVSRAGGGGCLLQACSLAPVRSTRYKQYRCTGCKVLRRYLRTPCTTDIGGSSFYPTAVDTRICFMITATNKLIIVLFYTTEHTSVLRTVTARICCGSACIFFPIHTEYTVETLEMKVETQKNKLPTLGYVQFDFQAYLSQYPFCPLSFCLPELLGEGGTYFKAGGEGGWGEREEDNLSAIGKRRKEGCFCSACGKCS